MSGGGSPPPARHEEFRKPRRWVAAETEDREFQPAVGAAELEGGQLVTRKVLRRGDNIATAALCLRTIFRQPGGLSGNHPVVQPPDPPPHTRCAPAGAPERQPPQKTDRIERWLTR